MSPLFLGVDFYITKISVIFNYVGSYTVLKEKKIVNF